MKRAHQQKDKHCFCPRKQRYGWPRKADSYLLGKGPATPVLKQVTKKETLGQPEHCFYSKASQNPPSVEENKTFGDGESAHISTHTHTNTHASTHEKIKMAPCCLAMPKECRDGEYPHQLCKTTSLLSCCGLISISRYNLFRKMSLPLLIFYVLDRTTQTITNNTKLILQI